jgi:hypothetical protein
LKLDASIGDAVFPDDGANAMTLADSAERATLAVQAGNPKRRA